MPRITLRGFTSFCALLILVGQARGDHREHALTQYAHTAWRVQEGFFSAPPQAIGQTQDGQLWVGGEGGVVRFDGMQFVPWKPPAGIRLRSERVYSLLGARDGSLWIGTDSGLARWKDDKLTVYAEEGLFLALLEDRDGTIWAGHTRALGRLPPLCRFSAERFDCFAVPKQTGLPVVGSLKQDPQGNLWIGGDGVVCRWQDARTNCHSIPRGSQRGQPNIVYSIASDSNGGLWVDGGYAGIWRFSSGRWDHVGEVRQLAPQSSAALTVRGDSVWTGGVGQGLARVGDGRTDRFDRSDGLSGDTVSCVFEDRDGNVWVATSGGLDRLRDVKVATLTTREGLPVDETLSIAASRDGSVWITSYTTLLRLRDGKVETYDARRLFGTDSVDAILEDSRGRLWIGASDRLIRRESERFQQPLLRLTRAQPMRHMRVTTLAEGADGTIWASTTDPTAALVHVRDNRILESFPREQFGGEQVTAIAADREGGIWIGEGAPRLTLYRNGRFEIRADPFPERTRKLFVDPHGVWAVTSKGLALYRNSRVTVLGASNGLRCDDLVAAVKDASATLWLRGPCGLMGIPAAELDAWVNDSGRQIQARVLDAMDGARAGFSDLAPREARSTDGRLWFTNKFAGVQVVDPARLADDPIAPSAAITDVVADRRNYPVGAALSLPPLTRDLAIDYTSYSPGMPGKVQFRYRLDGAGGTWLDAGHRRAALFSNLAPGRYRFEVLASNNGGLWSKRPALLQFEIAAAFYQTWWFRLVAAAAVASALWLAYRWRVRHLARQFQIALEARVSERTRIARELHDTLLQSFQGLLLRFQTAYELLSTRPAEARQVLQVAIDQAAGAIAEGRDAVQGLRSSSVETDDLAPAIRAFADELAAEKTGYGSIELSVVVEGSSRAVHPILRGEIYRIASEALRNAFRHARASRIEVELRYDDRHLRLRVRDDGKGIDPKFLDTEGRPGHFGLHGMRERARAIGGTFAVWSAPDSGTEVELNIPASRAYAAPAPTRRWWLIERLFPAGLGTRP